MYSSISENKRNTVIIFSLFIAIISGIGLFLSYIFDSYSMLFYAFIFAVVYAFFEYKIALIAVLKVNGARSVSKNEAPTLFSAAESISITAGISVPKLYIMEDPSMNAFAAGTKPENSIICVTTGLLSNMNKAELEGVIAHEISHIKNYDVRVSMAAIALTMAISFLADILMRIIFSFDDDEGFVFIIVLGLIIGVISPISAIVMQLAISRQREFLADATAVSLTRYPDGLISALEKLKDNKPLKRQNSMSSSLFISNPMKMGFFQRIFSTHPPLEDRIERLKNNSARL